MSLPHSSLRHMFSSSTTASRVCNCWQRSFMVLKATSSAQYDPKVSFPAFSSFIVWLVVRIKMTSVSLSHVFFHDSVASLRLALFHGELPAEAAFARRGCEVRLTSLHLYIIRATTSTLRILSRGPPSGKSDTYFQCHFALKSAGAIILRRNNATSVIPHFPLDSSNINVFLLKERRENCH